MTNLHEAAAQPPRTEAYIRGRSAGRLTLAPSLNPYPDSSPQAAEWFRGYQSSIQQLMRERIAQKTA